MIAWKASTHPRHRWSSYASSSLSTLVDLYLYVTPENYFSTTRPAYTAFLPWYANYIVPPARRAAAKQRTEHLGVRHALGASAADDDEAPDSASAKARGDGGQGGGGAAGPEAGFAARLAGLAKPSRGEPFRKAVRNLKLEALVARAVGPLDELLGQKAYFLSEGRACSLDAIALGYFKILLDAEVPDPWAAKLLAEKFPRLVRWCAYNDGFVSWLAIFRSWS
jgi:hypothetical protein